MFILPLVHLRLEFKKIKDISTNHKIKVKSNNWMNAWKDSNQLYCNDIGYIGQEFSSEVRKLTTWYDEEVVTSRTA